jgi:hypothetical protein
VLEDFLVNHGIAAAGKQFAGYVKNCLWCSRRSLGDELADPAARAISKRWDISTQDKFN